ncbi:MAG: AAA family ATPase [Lachnospiraceae bacterium]
MLTYLHVKNLALIDEAEVEFGPGLNILTGETGAGKSILMGSVNLALGQKMSREMLRDEEKACAGGTDFSGRQSKMCGTVEREGNLRGRRADYYIQKTYRKPEYQQVKR